MENWKIQKIQSIKDEVKELHPLLKQIFTNNKDVSRFEYTHGPTEMGADFIIARIDQTLGIESFTGIIAKTGNISQDITDIKRQIEECSVERYFDGGKKKIYLNEIWILTNGTISNGAERKIHEEFRNRNVHFIQGEKLCDWTERYARHYWSEISEELSKFLSETLQESANQPNGSTINISGVDIEINQELRPIPNNSPGKVFRVKKATSISLENAIENNKIITIEGGMGSGKTTILKKYARTLCEPTIYTQKKIIPFFVDYKKISTNLTQSIQDIVDKLFQIETATNPERVIIFIDGIDEADRVNTDIVEITKAIHDKICTSPKIRVALGTRNYWSLEEGIELHKYATRYQILPLSLDQIYRVVAATCSNLGISERLRTDLAKSELMKSIPRTPLAAVLLSKVLSAEAKEIPQTLPELYSKYVELALGRWDAGKGLVTEREYPIIISLLSRVAAYMLENRISEIGINEILQMFSEYTKTREGLPSAEKIFEKISTRSELIHINKGRGTFKFTHPSFTEYLLALNQKDNYGKNAPLTNPFNGRWLGVEYFYLGLIQDAGKRIESLANLTLGDEREKILRALNFGNLMLAAHQTEYRHIERAVAIVFSDTARLFTSISKGEVSSKLAVLPELQLLATLTYFLKNAFEYEFFKKALDTAQLECQIESTTDQDAVFVHSFLIDSVRAGLGEKDVYRFLADADFQCIPWAVKLGISHIATDEGLDLEQTERLIKKINKSTKGNSNLNKYIRTLYETPLIEDKLSK